MDAKQVQTILQTVRQKPDLTETEQLLLQVIDFLLEENQRLRDEIARLKGEKGKPKFKKNAIPKIANDPARQALHPPKEHIKTAKKEQLPIDEVRKVNLDRSTLPSDVVNKGYDTVVIQELRIERHNIEFQLAQWYSPSDGKTYGAPLPKEYQHSQFGPTLRTFILHQYHANQLTLPKLHRSLQDMGIDIAEGTLSDFVSAPAAALEAEVDQMYRTGLEVSSYAHVDDTGARHQASNHYTTTICNDFFTVFFTRKHKTRLNFLDILMGGHGLRFHFDKDADILLQDIKLNHKEHLFFTTLLGAQIFTEAELIQAVEKGLGKLPSKAKWTKILEAGALDYYLDQKAYHPIEQLMSDEAPQFVLPYGVVHGLCWVHIDRDFKKLIPFEEKDRAALSLFRHDFWQLYKDLKAYGADPVDTQKKALEDRFDTLFTRQTGYADLDALMEHTRFKKEKLLVILEHPGIPLHNNPAEQAIRGLVTKGKISFGTRSESGRKAWDLFQSVICTCRQLGLSFWKYLTDRINGTEAIPPLGNLVKQKAALVGQPK